MCDDNTEVKRLRDALRKALAFTESFHVSVNMDSYYKDVTFFCETPHSLAFRTNNDSSKSFILKDLEERRAATVLAIRNAL